MKTRIENTLRSFEKAGIDAFLVENPIDIFYFTGLEVSKGTLILSTSSELIVDGRYIEMAEGASDITIKLASSSAFRESLKGFKRIGFDGSYTTYERFEELPKDSITWVNLPFLIKKERAVKSDGEIELLEKSAALAASGYDLITSLLKEGSIEKELSILLDLFWKKEGAQGFSFDPIIAFGKNSSKPHYRASSDKLKKGDPVLIDIGALVSHYHSDMTRTLFFHSVDSEMNIIYEIVKEAQKAALSKLKPGVLIKDVDDAARKFIENEGYGDNFTHSLGHGIGLEIHEWPLIRNSAPYSDILLEENMCITIEPGIYLKGKGGVRIEDTVVITKEGYRSLTDRSTDLKIIYA